MGVILFTSLHIGCKSDGNKALMEDVSADIPKVFLAVKDVKVNDPFWSPKLKLWSDITLNDIFNKFEGKYEVESRPGLIDDYKRLGRTRDAFRNFDLVAQGKRKIGQNQHEGPEWYDGLVYESIRGSSDLLIQFPDKKMEERIDAYIDRIEAAQNSVGDGYINTHTMLVEPEHRWGLNGGFERGQHDVYNSGMLMEAAVHYY